MDVRRVNDVLKVVGAVVAALALFGPVFAHPHANMGALFSDLLAVLPGAVGAFTAGLGTRGPGVEYTAVTEAKVMASLVPPPLPPAPPPAGK